MFVGRGCLKTRPVCSIEMRVANRTGLAQDFFLGQHAQRQKWQAVLIDQSIGFLNRQNTKLHKG